VALFPGGAEGLIARTLQNDIHPGLIERAGAQFEQELSRFLTVPARDLKASRTNFLGQDRERDAQRGLTERVLLINLSAVLDPKNQSCRSGLDTLPRATASSRTGPPH